MITVTCKNSHMVRFVYTLLSPFSIDKSVKETSKQRSPKFIYGFWCLSNYSAVVIIGNVITKYSYNSRPNWDHNFTQFG